LQNPRVFSALSKAYAPSNGSGGGGHVGNVPPFPRLIAAALVVSVLVVPAIVVYVSVKRQRIYDDAYERCMQVSPAGAAGFAMGFPEGFPRHDVEGVIGKPIAVQNVDDDNVMAVYEYVGRHDKSHMYRMEIVYGPGDTIIESYPERDSRRPIQGGWEGCADKADRELRRVRRAGDLTIPPALLLRADQAIE
jgi:hypothetical protein